MTECGRAEACREAEQQPLVFVIDDDPAIRAALDDLIRSVGLGVSLFDTARAFLDSERPDVPSCIVLDVRLPGLGGLDLQRKLADAIHHPPIVFVTGHADISMCVRAMKAGAIDFLPKPFRDQELLDAIHLGIERDRVRRREVRAIAALQVRFASLTAREREIMAHVATGRMNKQIAGDLNVSEITVKVRRGHVMRKMGAKSFADLVRIADALGVTPESARYPVSSHGAGLRAGAPALPRAAPGASHELPESINERSRAAALAQSWRG